MTDAVRVNPLTFAVDAYRPPPGISVLRGAKMTDDERLKQIATDLAMLRYQMNLLFTALENVRVLSPVRDKNGNVVGLNAVVAPPMVETGIK